jgi:hypothetical protein
MNRAVRLISLPFLRRALDILLANTFGNPGSENSLKQAVWMSAVR